MPTPDSLTCAEADAAPPSATGYEVLVRHLADVHGVHARGTRSQLDAAHDRAQADADILRAGRLTDALCRFSRTLRHSRYRTDYERAFNGRSLP